jgi:hypothetical protein
MITASIPKPMPVLPCPGQKVRWRNPQHARACGWEAVFGPGPFAVVGTVDRSRHGLAAGLILHTRLGDREIPEVWLAMADEPENANSSCWGADGFPGPGGRTQAKKAQP